VTAIQLIQLALGLVRFANWITRRIDQSTWVRSGYQKAMAEQAEIIRKSIGKAEAAVKDAAQATPDDLRRRLGEDQ
jgi:hypothetical protein